METTAGTFTGSLTDMYMSVLATLSMDDRLDLIAKLSESLRHERTRREEPLDLRNCFSADWTDVDASSLRDRNNYGRTVQAW